jgi:hypothetical protein
MSDNEEEEKVVPIVILHMNHLKVVNTIQRKVHKNLQTVHPRLQMQNNLERALVVSLVVVPDVVPYVVLEVTNLNHLSNMHLLNPKYLNLR